MNVKGVYFSILQVLMKNIIITIYSEEKSKIVILVL